MIRVESNKNATTVKISGDFPTLCADTVYILRGIHNSIAEASERHGAIYEQVMRDCLIKLAFDMKDDEEKKEAEKEEASEKKEDDSLDGIMAIIKAIMEA